jgi:hypothetical protein
VATRHQMTCRSRVIAQLDAFRAARHLVWVRRTPFQPRGVADGDLIADNTLRMELHTWMPDDIHTRHYISSAGVGIATAKRIATARTSREVK